MSTPELIASTMAPMTGHNTTWTLKYDGQTIDVKLERGTRPVSIDNLDTGRQIKTTSKRGRAIVALVLDAYVARFGDDPTTPKGETMTDQTTYISPDLQLAEDEDGALDIIHGDTEVYIPGPGLHPVSGVKEAFRILMALTYSRKDYSDGSFCHWAFFRDGSEFWTYGESLDEVVQRAAERIGMYLAGRNGYPLFDGILDLDEVK